MVNKLASTASSQQLITAPKLKGKTVLDKTQDTGTDIDKLATKRLVLQACLEKFKELQPKPTAWYVVPTTGLPIQTTKMSFGYRVDGADVDGIQFDRVEIFGSDRGIAEISFLKNTTTAADNKPPCVEVTSFPSPETHESANRLCSSGTRAESAPGQNNNLFCGSDVRAESASGQLTTRLSFSDVRANSASSQNSTARRFSCTPDDGTTPS
jgi:hypothetical protein